MSFIRSSKHSFDKANKRKLSFINHILLDFRNMSQNLINYLWINPYNFNGYHFNISKNKLDIPTFLSTELYKKNSNSNFKFDQKYDKYSSRFKALVVSQVRELLCSVVERRKKQLFMLIELQKENKDTKSLQKSIDNHPLIKPKANKININFDSSYIDFKFDQKKFLTFIRIKSIFSKDYKISKKERFINIPIENNPIYQKWNSLGKRKNSIRFSDNHINIIFDVPEPPKNTTGETVSCDQGINNMITFSDNQKIKKYQDKFLLKDVLNRLSRKKKGSKAFKRTQQFRTNLINWSINQLNFKNIKELRLEKLFQVRKGKSSSRLLSHWAYTEINNKLKKVSEEKGFSLREMPNEFRSQRCSKCSLVRKANRKKQTFKCVSCGYTADSDENACSNLLLDLYPISDWVRLGKYNVEGFYWKPEGLYDLESGALVPDTKRE
jgi:transposase